MDFNIIPDILSLGGIIAGGFLSVFRTNFSFLQSLSGIFAGGAILYAIALIYKIFTKREGMGGGDIKLLGMIGSFCGLEGVLFSIMLGSFFGSIVGIPLMLIKGKDMKYAIPFGPFLSFGAVVFVFLGEHILYYFVDVIGGR